MNTLSPIRFAILAGVSTDAQAREEKSSIPDQVKTCRAKIAHLEGLAVGQPYIMDGYSRTGYDSLEIAMREIPPLGAAIRAAHADEYDVLIMDNFDRLGDLAFIVSIRFKKLKKQLYSARQSGKLARPEDYDPYTTEDVDIHMHAQGIVQAYRINKVRRGWNAGIPQRARDGLHPLSLPFGYQVSAKGQPAEQIPAECALILEMKDMYLAGQTLQAICDHADASGVKPRRAKVWHRQVVKRIVNNPFYAGIVEFGRHKKDGDKRIAVPPSKWIRSEGQHQALWDESTYLNILAETERRDGLRSRGQRYALSGLLECAVCQTRLSRHGSLPYVYISCDHGHISSLRYEHALELVAKKVTGSLLHYRTNPTVVDSKNWQAQIDQQYELRRRVQEGFEAKLYTALEAQQRIVAIETEIERLTRKRDRARQQAQQKQALLQFAAQDLQRLERWIIEDDPTAVNQLLTVLCEKVTITPDLQLTVVWRA